MKINKKLTKINYQKGSNRKIKYIVIHYVGAEGTAEANCKYFEKIYRGASAHYFVGHKGEIWQCVEDKNIAWHCGALVYKHKSCRNANSIGVEMCCRKKNGKWYFEDETVSSTVGLVKELMKKHNVPADNVIRHYDVTNKQCPEPYVRNNDDWKKFKKQLTTTSKKEEKSKKKSNEEIAKEIIQGKWGNGATRKKKLKEAGYDYNAIQKIVNKLLS